MSFVTGDSIGDYKVLDLVGSGGMGSVYRIEHTITRRIEAMKLLPLGLRSGPEELHRFEREIQVQARLQHPNIAAVYNAIRDGSSIALIMEYVQGESLQKKFGRGKLPIHTALDYARQVLDALAFAHENGVVHRDVSPANIIVTPAGVAKLTDFGLARAVTDLRLTTTGVAVGSPWYMSPEQVRAVEEIDARTDIYAAGAVLHEMLTGTKLFDAEGSFAVMRAHTEMTPKPPSAHTAGIPPALDKVVARAVAKDPAARFQTAGEFRVALDAIGADMRPSPAVTAPPDARLIADHNFRSRRICRTDRQHERRAVETEIRTTSGGNRPAGVARADTAGSGAATASSGRTRTGGCASGSYRRASETRESVPRPGGPSEAIGGSRGTRTRTAGGAPERERAVTTA